MAAMPLTRCSRSWEVVFPFLSSVNLLMRSLEYLLLTLTQSLTCQQKVKFSSKEECPGALVDPWGRHRVPLHTVSSCPSWQPMTKHTAWHDMTRACTVLDVPKNYENNQGCYYLSMHRNMTLIPTLKYKNRR